MHAIKTVFREAVGLFVNHFPAHGKLRRQPVKIRVIEIPEPHARLRQAGFGVHFDCAMRGDGNVFRQRGLAFPVNGGGQ